MRLTRFTLTDGETEYDYDGYAMTEATADKIIELLNAWKNRSGSD